MLDKVKPLYFAPIVAVLIGIIAFSLGEMSNDGLTITNVVDVFSDIDNDGDEDYIITADVVLNGSTNFLLTDTKTGDTIEQDKEFGGGAPIGLESGGSAPPVVLNAVFTIFREIEDPLMSSGESYAEWKNRAATCPEDFPYWTTITLPGDEEFICLHRSGYIYHKPLADGEIHISLLIDSLPVPLDTRVKVKVEYP